MSSANEPAPRPSEQLPIPLFDAVVLAVRDASGSIWLDRRDLCIALSANPDAQRRRIEANESLRLQDFRVQVGTQLRTRDFLLLDDVPLWVMTLQTTRMSSERRQRVRFVKDQLEDAVRTRFAEIIGLPTQSRAIEDLADVDRINQAFSAIDAIFQRQEAIEGSQDRARSAFRDLAAELRALKERVGAVEWVMQNKLTPQQRGTLFRMVQAWGAARAENQSDAKVGVAIRRCWAELNAHFGIATYTDLPAGRYDEAARYVQQEYRILTGQELPIIEQRGFDEGAS